MYTKSYTVYKENKMSKYIQEMQNKYSRGHEQMEKRTYLVVYDRDYYVLAFSLTTKIKKLNSIHRIKIQL